MTFPKPNQTKEEPKIPSDLEGVDFILDTELLPKHRNDSTIVSFISAYLECRQARQAARAVGLPAEVGDRLIKRPDIYRAIKKITDAAVMKFGYDAAEVVERVKEVAGLDPGALYVDGKFIEEMDRIPPEVRRGIKKFKAKNIYEKDPNGMEVVVGKLIEVEFWDKMRAVELLGREQDLFMEKKVVQHDISANMRNVLLSAAQRARELGNAPTVERAALEAPRDVGGDSGITTAADTDNA